MNKTAQSEFHRLFLIEKLPEPLGPASRHLQILDRYIDGTRIRLRQMRDPYSNERTQILQKRIEPSTGTESRSAEIHLDDHEYSLFDQFGGREIRKNRYFHEFDLVMYAFDVYLGPLKGLNLARVDFETGDAALDLAPPGFSVIEVTNEPFFAGKHLANKDFSEVASEIERLAAMPQIAISE
jgi:CYTH domain-containing protein